jgi:hypothetical protein
MPTARTLNAANLEALGAPRLAELLLDISAGDAATRRRLRLALAGNAGPAAAAHEVRKRLASIARSKTFIEQHQTGPLTADLRAQHRAIIDIVAPGDPREAFDLIWRLVECAGPVFARADDSNGELSGAFEDAAGELGRLAQAAKLDPDDLAARAFEALRGDQYGQWDGLVAGLAPALGADGLARLKTLTLAWQAEPVVKPAEKDRQVIGWSSSTGKIYADDMAAAHRKHASQAILKEIADAQGDVDSYIAQIEPDARKMPLVAAEIARRLLAARRPRDAFKIVESVPAARRAHHEPEWEQARMDTLDALGRTEEAQAFRWKRYLATLNADYLRAYLRKLPDFDSFDAEQIALAHALECKNVHQALAFVIEWPDLTRAAQLVTARTQELNGNLYELLSSAADALGDKHPLAATLALRAMIDHTLGESRVTRYKHAARHLRACASLDPRIADFAGHPDHATYERALRAAHGRKAAFWQEV